jgi:hypothetical protein
MSEYIHHSQLKPHLPHKEQTMNGQSHESRQRPVKKVWMTRDTWLRAQQLKQLVAFLESKLAR